MPRQKTRTNTKNKGNEALQSLLNDEAEARMKKEISISRSKSGPKDRNTSGKSEKESGSKTARSVPGLEPEVQARGPELRKQPTMKETKVQLIERMNKIIQEIDKMEAGLEQKDQEIENAVKERDTMACELHDFKVENKSLQEQIGKKDKELKAAAAEKVQLENTVQNLEMKSRDLESGFTKTEDRVKELVSEKERLHKDCTEKEEEIGYLKQEIKRLEKENQNKDNMAAGEDPESSAHHVHTEASAWRSRADELWDGSGYQVPQKALYYLNAALELRPDWPEALNDRGLAYLDENRLDDAIEDLTTALALKNQFAEAYHNRGVALLRAGKKFAATKDFQMAARYGVDDGVDVLQSA